MAAKNAAAPLQQFARDPGKEALTRMPLIFSSNILWHALWRDLMNWLSDQVNAATIAGVVSLATSLIIATMTIILTTRKMRPDFKLEFAAEGLAKAILMDRKWRYRTFRALKYHLGGFTDDELRKILIRAGGIRFTAGGQEVWGLLSRNREFLCVDEIKETPTARVAFDRAEQPQNPQQEEVRPLNEPDASRDSSDAFARVRAEMIKLGKLECVKT
jgi:hypothetical protein